MTRLMLKPGILFCDTLPPWITRRSCLIMYGRAH